MKLERIVQLTYRGQRFTFRIESESSVDFWTVESQGTVWHTPIIVSGGERSGFFRALAQRAIDLGCISDGTRAV